MPEHRQLRSGLCCAIAASRGHACAAERATLHLVLNALNGAAADATLSSDLQHTLAGPQLTLDSLFQGWVLSVACQAAYPHPRPALAQH